MSDYVLSCCSTADLTAEHFAKRNISFVPFHFAIDGKEYFDDLGGSMPFEEFYEKMSRGAETRTSQVNIQEYVEYFSRILDTGKDIVHICLSSGLSGTVNSARNAALIVGERYPERRVYVVDSLGASSGYGMLVCAAADKRDEGFSAAELCEWIEERKLHLHHWFFSTDLSSYVKGGRISKAVAVFGGMLEICPLLNMDANGHLVPRAKIRTKKKVIREIVRMMEEHAEGGLDYSGKCGISHSDCYDDALTVAKLIEEKFTKLDGKVEIDWVGTAIGAHTGPGTIALYFWGDERE